MKNCLFLILAITIFGSCKYKKCPPSREVGRMELSDTTISYLKVGNYESLVYKDSTNRLVQFARIEKAMLYTQDCISNFCDAGWPLGWECDYVTYENRWAEFISDSLTMAYSLRMRSLVPPTGNSGNLVDTNSTVEQFSVNLYTNVRNKYPAIYGVVSMRGSYNSAEDSLANNNYSLEEERKFIDSTYHNLYTLNDSIWFNREFGIVAFKYKDNVFELSSRQ